jgi:predicted Zn-ribbon and HTH transcriptional regulator
MDGDSDTGSDASTNADADADVDTGSDAATDATTRQRIADALREEAATASDLSRAVGIPRSSVYGHLRHVARSLDGDDEQFLVAPPECTQCGFSDFDDPVNCPSRCPQCRSEGIEEAVFKVE